VVLGTASIGRVINPEKRASEKRRGRIVPQSSGFGTQIGPGKDHGP
jgi:hypothetical protein